MRTFLSIAILCAALHVSAQQPAQPETFQQTLPDAPSQLLLVAASPSPAAESSSSLNSNDSNNSNDPFDYSFY
ncbi:MAG TPA: hypothetical protein VHW70_05355, partial [Edaphobacter sp.]|nr:hypothetical protein [Edaphobacter sp.]